MSVCYSIIDPLQIYTWFLKNQFRKIKFHELDFSSIWNWIYTACVARKNQFQNWFLQATLAVKIKFKIDQKIQFIKLDFSKLIFQKSSIDQQGDRVTRSRAECPDGIFAKFTDKCVCTIMCPSPSPPPPSQFSLSHSAQAVQCCMCNRSHLVIWFLILHYNLQIFHPLPNDQVKWFYVAKMFLFEMSHSFTINI